jgi:hypothetical protein
METLFKFTLARPAIIQEENAPSILLSQDSPFQAALGQAQQNENPREAIKPVARQFIASAEFVGDPKNLPLYGKLKVLSAEFEKLEKKQNVTNAKAAAAVEEAFGKKPADLVGDKDLDAPAASLKDSLIAIKHLPEEHRRNVEGLTQQLRDMEVIVKIANESDFPGTGGTLRRYRRRSVQLPEAVELRSSLSTLEKLKELEEKRKEEEERKRKEAEAKLELYKWLNEAIEDLTNLDSEHLQNTPQREDPGFLVAERFRPTQLAIQELTQYEQIAKLDITRLENVVNNNEGNGIERVAQIKSAEVLIKDLSSKELALPIITGNGPFTPLTKLETAFRLKATAEGSLLPSTLELLKLRNLGLSENPLDFIVEKLRKEVIKLTEELDIQLGRPVQRSFKRYGNTMVMTTMPTASIWNNIVVAGNLTSRDPIILNMSVPTSFGSIAPAGIADLQLALRPTGALYLWSPMASGRDGEPRMPAQTRAPPPASQPTAT